MITNSNISLVVITYNEERHLAQTIESCIGLVNEIIIVDSGSSDSTCQIAKGYDAKIMYNKFTGFGKQKQFAVSCASNDWVLCLDADETLSDTLKINIRELLNNPRDDAYNLTRCNKFMGKYLRHGAGYPDDGIRLFNKQTARWSDDIVHEKVIVDGTIGKLSGDYLHDSVDTLDKYLSKQNRYTTMQAETMNANGKKFKLSKLVLSPIWHFIKYYFIKLGFLDGVPGLVHILIGSWNSFVKYAKLYDLTRSQKHLGGRS